MPMASLQPSGEAPSPLSDGDLVLVPAEDCGLSRLRQLLGRPEVYQDWGGSPMTDAEISHKYLGGRADTVEAYVIHHRNADVGLILFHLADDGADGGGLDMVVAADARGTGVGTRAARLATSFAKRALGWDPLTVDPDVGNDRGIGFWQRVGFAPVAVVDDGSRPAYLLMYWHEPLGRQHDSWRDPGSAGGAT